MPGARPPPKPAMDVQVDKTHPNQLLDLEKRNIIPKTSMRDTSRASTVLFYCGLNAILSASLIAFNKYLMNEQRFPYAAPLALADSSIKNIVFCLAALFAVQLVFSNVAYLYSSVVFIQMMKEGNLPFVYLLSVCTALESFHVQRAGVLLVIVFATLITIKGEMRFTWNGFCVQSVSQMFEVARIVLQGAALNAKGYSLDVLTYMVLVMPACALILGSFLIFNACVWQVGTVPTLDALVAWWPQLLLNAVLAVALNFSTALVVKHASAVGLVLSGIMKDTVIVISGACFLGENITSVQVLGFVLQISGILVYSLIKAHPETFSDGVLRGLKRVCRMEAGAPASSLLPMPTSVKQQRYDSAQTCDSAY